MAHYYISDEAYESLQASAKADGLRVGAWIEAQHQEWTTHWELYVADEALRELIDTRTAQGLYKGVHDPVVWMAAIGSWVRIPRGLVISRDAEDALAEWAQVNGVWRKQRVPYTAMLAGYALEMFGRRWVREKRHDQ